MAYITNRFQGSHANFGSTRHFKINIPATVVARRNDKFSRGFAGFGLLAIPRNGFEMQNLRWQNRVRISARKPAERLLVMLTAVVLYSVFPGEI